MKILYIGDIMATPGIQAVEHVLPELRKKHSVDLVIAQSENVTAGKGMSPDDYGHLKQLGVDFFTGGNHSLANELLLPLLDDPQEPVIRPANYPLGTPGQRWKYVLTQHGKVLVISLLGSIVGKDADRPMDNPLKVIDEILDKNKGVERTATIVNLHGDFSSEKVMMGHYLDGRVTAVIGDHWHVPTADARVLPGSTAYITDVGMCGALNSSLGVKFESVIPRWRDGIVNKNSLELAGTLQFNAVLISLNTLTGLASSVELVQQTIERP